MIEILRHLSCIRQRMSPEYTDIVVVAAIEEIRFCPVKRPYKTTLANPIQRASCFTISHHHSIQRADECKEIHMYKNLFS